MPFSKQFPLLSSNFPKSSLSPGSSNPWGRSSTAGSSLYSPLGSPCSTVSYSAGAKLPDTPSDTYAIWRHASYLFHQRRYASALLTFQYLVLRPSIPSYILRRLYINIGIIQLALHNASSASASFQTAFTTRDSTNTEFITSPRFDDRCNITHTSNRHSTSTSLTALAAFLRGIATWELGALDKAQTFFDCCVALFDDNVDSESEAFERCMRYFNFEPLGLAFILDIGQPRRNGRFCAERLKLERRIPMRAAWTWEMHRLPEDVLFEADRGIMVEGGEQRGEEGEEREVKRSRAYNIHALATKLEMVQVKINGAFTNLTINSPTSTTTTIPTTPTSQDHSSRDLSTHLPRKTVRFSRFVDVIQDIDVNDTTIRAPMNRPPSVPRRSSLRNRPRHPPDEMLPSELPLVVEDDAVKVAGDDAVKVAEIEVWLEAL